MCVHVKDSLYYASLTGVCVVESHRFSSDSIKHQCVFMLKTRSTMLLSQECVLLSLTGVCVVESHRSVCC